MLLILNGPLGVLFAVYFISLKITKKEGVSVINAIIDILPQSLFSGLLQCSLDKMIMTSI